MLASPTGAEKSIIRHHDQPLTEETKMETKTMRLPAKRLIALAAGLAAFVAATAVTTKVTAQQPKSVKIAVIVPLSGPWARQGQLVKFGAETAVEEINASGGIQSMGGARLELVSIDAGDTAEK